MDSLNKEERMKKINEKLNLMMQKKGITLDFKLTQKAVQKKVEEPKDINRNQQQQPQHKVLEKHKKIRKQEKRQKNLKPQTHNFRKAAGEVWQDKTMQQWPQNDYRIFVGNLGNQTSDEVLANAFRHRYTSFNMARVVKDKRTGKTKGYGFVSFANPRDFLNSLKQMNGQYIGNRPAKIVKSNWKDRDLNSQKNQELPSDFKANSKKQTNKVFTDFKYVHPY